MAGDPAVGEFALMQHSGVTAVQSLQSISESHSIHTGGRVPPTVRRFHFRARLPRRLMVGIVTAAAHAIVPSATAQVARSTDSAHSAKVDEYIRAAMESQQIPGMAVAVMRNGRIIHVRGYGLANVEHRIPVGVETVFQSGSVGKAFTVTAVMMLVDAGTLRLDDKLTTHFPDAPQEWDKITVRHLLEHTSGMTGYPEDFDFRRDRTEDELYQMIRGSPLAFAPGERRGYSNLGFVLLGILINKVTGQHYGDFLQEKVFRPLEMTNARVISEAEIVPNRASGYRLVEGELRNQEWVAPSLNTTADGALYLSVLDVAKWEAALNSGALLTKQSFDAMWGNLRTNDGEEQPWGFSWQIETINGRRIVEHSGGWQGFTANFSRYPAAKLAVIVFTNLRAANPVALTRGIQEIYQPELGIAGLGPIRDTDPAVAAFVTEFLRKITAKALTADLFVPPLGDQMMSDSDAAANEFVSYGELQRMELVGREPGSDGATMHRYRLTYETRQVVFSIGLAKNGKVNAIDLRR